MGLISITTTNHNIVDGEGNPANGSVIIRPNAAWEYDTATGRDKVSPAPLTVSIVNGKISGTLQLAPSLNGGVDVVDAAYVATYQLNNTLEWDETWQLDANGPATLEWCDVPIVASSMAPSIPATGPIGPQGPAGTMMNWTGAYNPGVPYVANDGVEFGGRGFVALQPSTGTSPPSTATSSAYWSLFADKGADGLGTGDMLAATYDPTAKAADAFSMDNMAEGATTKIMTAIERSKLAAIASGADVSQEAIAAAADRGLPVDADKFALLAGGVLNVATWANMRHALNVAILQFFPHESATPDMNVQVEAGGLLVSSGFVSQAAQTAGPFTAPTTNPRIDRIVIDQATAAVSIVAGTEAAIPVAPAVPAGKIPLAQVSLVVAQTTILNADIGYEMPSLWGASSSTSLVNLANASPDVALAIGQVGYINFAAVSNVPLNVATADGEEYEGEVFIDFNGMTKGAITPYLNANNTTYAAAFNHLAVYGSSAGAVSSVNSGVAGWALGAVTAGALYYAKFRISTSTLGKHCFGQASQDTGSAVYHANFSSYWNDFFTSYSSLGTLALTNAYTGTVLVRRLK